MSRDERLLGNDGSNETQKMMVMMMVMLVMMMKHSKNFSMTSNLGCPP